MRLGLGAVAASMMAAVSLARVLADVSFPIVAEARARGEDEAASSCVGWVVMVAGTDSEEGR